MDGLRRVTVTNAVFNLPALALMVEDSAFVLYSRFKEVLQRPSTYANKFIADESTTDDKENLMAGRCFIENLVIGKVEALADIHLSTAKTGLPVAVDTDRYEAFYIINTLCSNVIFPFLTTFLFFRSPLSIPRISIHHIVLPPQTLWQALASHVMAEALLNAPLVLGSLQLFFNPTGLVRSIKRGVADMIDLPMQGLQEGPLQFIAGVGQGSVSLVKEISGWSLSSVVGFSRAASNAIAGSFARSSDDAILHTASSESELLLSEVDSVPFIYGFARLADHLKLSSMTHADSFGEILLFSDAASITIYQGTAQQPLQAKFKLSQPVLVLATHAVFLYSDGGSTPSLVAWLQDGSIFLKNGALEVHSRRAAPFSDLSYTGAATIAVKFNRMSWEKISPSLRHLIPQ